MNPGIHSLPPVCLWMQGFEGWPFHSVFLMATQMASPPVTFQFCSATIFAGGRRYRLDSFCGAQILCLYADEIRIRQHSYELHLSCPRPGCSHCCFLHDQQPLLDQTAACFWHRWIGRV